MAGQAKARVLFGRSDRTIVLKLEGAVCYTVARPLRAFLDASLATEPTELVLCDLRGTTFVDSTGLGLVACAGKLALSRTGRRAVLVSAENDVLTVLRSAALDVLFVIVPEPPVELPDAFDEVPLTQAKGTDDGSLGRTILEAHRDLAALSEKNRDEYRDVIAALEAELFGASLRAGE